MKKFFYAWNGWKLAIRDRSLFCQLLLGFVAVIGGIVVKLSVVEWLFWVMAITLVLLSEGFNSCIERVANLIDLRENKAIKELKDFSAGIVLFCSFISLLMAILVLLHHFGGINGS